MRKVLIAGCAALFFSIAGLAQTAQTPSPAPLSQETLEAILGSLPSPASRRCHRPQSRSSPRPSPLSP